MNKKKPKIIRDKGGRELSADEIEQQEIRRTRLPKGTETLGIVDQRLGAGRLKVRCLDAKERVCRIPGRLKRFLWVRENDIILIEPWELDGDNKGDVVFKYRRSQVDWLKKNGYLKDLTETDEF